MDLDHGACYRAICLRDARFDGRFFTGVKTTGIYCRPICPARTPRSENVTFYPTAAAAQEAGSPMSSVPAGNRARPRRVARHVEYRIARLGAD